MKQLTTLLAASIICGNSYGQIALEVKTADLSANGKSNNARFVSAARTGDEIKLTFSTRGCEVKDLGTMMEFDGSQFNFEHLIFDGQLRFKRLDKETVTGMGKALAIAPVLGAGVEIKDPYGYWPGAGREGAWLDQYKYHPKIYATTGSKTNGPGCVERLEAKKTDFKIPFTGEGYLYSYPSEEGITTVTYAAVAGTEAVKAMCRIYSFEGVKKKETVIDIPYKNFAARFLRVPGDGGVNDHIMILQPTTGWNKYGVKVAETKSNPLEFEYFRIDGRTLALKEHFTFNAVNSQWLVEQAVVHNGALYLMGQSSAKVKQTGYAYGTFPTSEGGNFQNAVRIDELENYQVMRVENGKLASINAITPDDMEKVQQNISGGKGGNSPSGYFRFQEVKFANGNMYITGQNTSPGKDGDNRKEQFMLVLNANLKPERLFYVPKNNYSNSNMFLSADNKTMYWAIYDYSEFDVTASRKEPTQIKMGMVTGGNDHVITNKQKNDDGPTLQLTKIDLQNNTAPALQTCSPEDYTLLDECPVLYSNKEEVVFLGVSGGKKERVAKFITLKL